MKTLIYLTGILCCLAVQSLAQNATTDPVGFQSGLHFYKNSISPSNQIQNIVAPSLIDVFYGVYDATSNSFSSYWDSYYSSTSSVTSNPYPLTLALDNGEGILLGTIHPYHPALMYSNESNGNPTQPNPWYGIPFGNQKLGILFRYTESISGQQTVFESLILPSQNSVGFIGSTDETPWGQIFQQESNISIVLVPEPKSVFLLIIGFAFLLSFRRIIPLGNIFQKKARNS